MMELSDINVEPITGAQMCEMSDTGFEPQSRLRANTWPVRPQGFSTPEEESKSGTPPVPEDVSEGSLEYAGDASKESSSPAVIGKKGGTRRNAWGSLSYADLISKAIDNSPEKRLTLSQIYDWMVQNVPYFKDKGDNNSSAGWKNSIRHNLSLHNRFMRVQNEGTGKSSWWIINPDAKPGKTPRRRAASMDPKEMSKKRGRAKKRVDELRTGDFETYRQHSNPGSEYSSTNDLSVAGDPFTISPHDIRARAGSNASSFGRLSPIQAGFEPDIDDGFGSNWSDCMPNGKDFMPDRHFTSGAESVSEHLAELFMGDVLSTVPEKIQSLGEGSHTSAMNSLGKIEPSGFHPNPPAYSSHLNVMGMQSQRGSFGVVRPDGIGSLSSLPQNASLSSMHSGEMFKNSEQFSPGGSVYSNKPLAGGMSLRDLLSDGADATQQHRHSDFGPDMKFLQECNSPPNRSLPSPKEITRSPSGGSFVPSIRISPQQQQQPLQQPMMIRGITNTILQQQQQQQQQLNSQHLPNAQVLRNLQQRVSNDNLLQAVQMRGMQQQMLRSPTHIKQEPAFPTSPLIAKSEPVSPISCLPHSPVNHLPNSRYSGSDLTMFIKQEHQQHGAMTYPTRDCVQQSRVLPPPMPMDLDFSLQELRAGGLECDMDRILQEGNFDLEFHAGIGIYGDAPYS